VLGPNASVRIRVHSVVVGLRPGTDDDVPEPVLVDETGLHEVEQQVGELRLGAGGQIGQEDLDVFFVNHGDSFIQFRRPFYIYALIMYRPLVNHFTREPRDSLHASVGLHQVDQLNHQVVHGLVLVGVPLTEGVLEGVLTLGQQDVHQVVRAHVFDVDVVHVDSFLH